MENTKVEKNARILKAMGNDKRLSILYQLLKGELNVGELEKLVKLSQSALSQHLAVLRAEGIVRTRREAQTIYYSLNNSAVVKILKLLKKLNDA